jgi:hypothetical protein
VSTVFATTPACRAPTFRRVAWPLSQWPEADRKTFERARVSGDFLSEDGAAAQWRDATVRAALGEYGRFLAFLDIRSLLDPTQGPADRVTLATLGAYIAALQIGCSSRTVASYIGILGMMIQVIVPTVDWAWFWTVHAKLKRRSKPSRNKRTKLVPSRALLHLGQDLMTQAESAPDPPAMRAALGFRDGLMIALLAMRPLRQKNFIGIVIDRHLVRDGAGYALCFLASETIRPQPPSFPRLRRQFDRRGGSRACPDHRPDPRPLELQDRRALLHPG